MKKVLLIFSLFMIVTFGSAACSGQKASDGTTIPQEQKTDPVTSTAATTTEQVTEPTETQAPLPKYVGTNRGNYINSGYVVEGDGYVYFCDPELWRMWRMKPDGRDAELLIEESTPFSINYKDGALYYVDYMGGGTYTADPDGRNARKVSENNVFALFFDGQIYYLANERASLNTISEDWASDTVVYDARNAGESWKLENVTAGMDGVFFIAKDSESEKSTLYAMPSGGGAVEILGHEDGAMSGLVWHDDMLYYRLSIPAADNSVRTVSLRACMTDGSEDKELVADFGGYYNIDGDSVFYSTDAGFVRHSLTDGSEREVALNKKIRMIDICDGWLYYTVSSSFGPNGGQVPAHVGRVAPDGSEHEIFFTDTGKWFSAEDAPDMEGAPYEVEGTIGDLSKEKFRRDFAQWLLDADTVEKMADNPTLRGTEVWFEVGSAGVVDFSQEDTLVVAIYTFVPPEEYDGYFRAAMECSGLSSAEIAQVEEYIDFAAQGFTDTLEASNGITYETGRNNTFMLLTLRGHSSSDE